MLVGRKLIAHHDALRRTPTGTLVREMTAPCWRPTWSRDR